MLRNLPGLVSTSAGRVLFLLAGGVLMGLAPVYAWPLAWVGMVPLWRVAIEAIAKHYRLGQALRLAGVWGVGYHGTALGWITGLHPMMWMGVPWLGSIAIALFAWAFITLWGAAIGMSWMGLIITLSRDRRLSKLGQILVGTALWCTVEWVWSKGPLYWTSLSYTQSPGNLWILQLGQIAGPITITASLVAVNGLLAQGWGETTRNITKNKMLLNTLRPTWTRAFMLCVSLHCLGLGLYSHSFIDTPERSLRVGLIQGNIPTPEKLSEVGVKTSRKAYLQGYELLAQKGVDLVLTPEGAIPQVWEPFVQDRNPFQRAVIQRGVPLVLGTFARKEMDNREIGNSRTPLTQSLLTITPDGTIAGRYNKVKLVPLGEYIPFENVLGGVVGRLSPFGESMAPGRFDQRLETPLGPVAAGICYESAFTGLFRQQVRNGGEVIFTASNNDPYPPRQMMQHHAQDVMRAVETNRWAVRVTNTGISGVVDPKGHTVWRSVPDEYVTHVATVYRRRSRTLYVRFGDWLTPLLLALSLVTLWTHHAVDLSRCENSSCENSSCENSSCENSLTEGP
ncbi:MAG: apolipoprotein N-acyltransferase [Cyanobacteria bacterium P01_D01_bin.105]